MKILEKGKIPGEKIAQARCGSCKTLFEFAQKEATLVPDQRAGCFYKILCPLEGCGKLVVVNPSVFKER